jgi:hypothetical protein
MSHEEEHTDKCLSHPPLSHQTPPPWARCSVPRHPTSSLTVWTEVYVTSV